MFRHSVAAASTVALIALGSGQLAQATQEAPPPGRGKTSVEVGFVVGAPTTVGDGSQTRVSAGPHRRSAHERAHRTDLLRGGGRDQLDAGGGNVGRLRGARRRGRRPERSPRDLPRRPDEGGQRRFRHAGVRPRAGTARRQARQQRRRGLGLRQELLEPHRRRRPPGHPRHGRTCPPFATGPLRGDLPGRQGRQHLRG